eukprot:364435-Chlamydomonas_euryale.AAC.1
MGGATGGVWGVSEDCAVHGGVAGGLWGVDEECVVHGGTAGCGMWIRSALCMKLQRGLRCE